MPPVGPGPDRRRPALGWLQTEPPVFPWCLPPRHKPPRRFGRQRPGVRLLVQHQYAGAPGRRLELNIDIVDFLVPRLSLSPPSRMPSPQRLEQLAHPPHQSWSENKPLVRSKASMLMTRPRMLAL